jgi:Ca2+-binding EF-hand superfamily protein
MQLLDKDGDGKVTLEELRARASQLVGLDEDKAEAVMKALDADQNGYVDEKQNAADAGFQHQVHIRR